MQHQINRKKNIKVFIFILVFLKESRTQIWISDCVSKQHKVDSIVVS
jgi:hypothetical protein